MKIGIAKGEARVGDYVMDSAGACVDIIYRIKALKGTVQQYDYRQRTYDIQQKYLLEPVLELGIGRREATDYKGRHAKLANRTVVGSGLIKLDVLTLCQLRSQLDIIINQIANQIIESPAQSEEENK